MLEDLGKISLWIILDYLLHEAMKWPMVIGQSVRRRSTNRMNLINSEKQAPVSTWNVNNLCQSPLKTVFNTAKYHLQALFRDVQQASWKHSYKIIDVIRKKLGHGSSAIWWLRIIYHKESSTSNSCLLLKIYIICIKN